MIYTVTKYSQTLRHHTIEDSNKKEYYVDLFVSDSFEGMSPSSISEQTGISEIEFMESIIGKKIEIDELNPYEYIAEGIRIKP